APAVLRPGALGLRRLGIEVALPAPAHPGGPVVAHLQVRELLERAHEQRVEVLVFGAGGAHAEGDGPRLALVVQRPEERQPCHERIPFVDALERAERRGDPRAGPQRGEGLEDRRQETVELVLATIVGGALAGAPTSRSAPPWRAVRTRHGTRPARCP